MFLTKIKLAIIKIIFKLKFKLNVDILDFILVILIRSNHPKRIECLTKNLSNFNNKNLFLDRKTYDNLNIFIGDSHSEFSARNFQKLDNNKNLNLTFWTGPTLLITFSTSKLIENKIVNFINFFSKKINYKKINIIFSFGEIDVRSAFYKLIVIDKTYKNSNSLINFVVNNLKKKIISIKKKIKIKEKITFFFRDIHPTPNYEGVELKKKNLNNLFFPVLGNISSRVKWRNKIKRKIRKTFKTRELFYLELDKICFSKTNGAINKNIAYDKHHIAQDKIVYEYQKKINNQSY